jgi:hypothetical protein
MQAALFFLFFLKKNILKSIDFSESACIFDLSNSPVAAGNHSQPKF